MPPDFRHHDSDRFAPIVGVGLHELLAGGSGDFVGGVDLRDAGSAGRKTG
jgi:hypothetical protein